MLHFGEDPQGSGDRGEGANQCRLAAVFPDGPVPLAEIVSRLERLLAGSPADATEISWLEVRRGQESNGKRRRDTYELHERTVLFRVRESGRTGLHRTSVSNLSDLENALRDALAQARLSPPSPEPLAIPGGDAPVDVRGVFDPELARMTPGAARDLLQRLAARGETARIGWSEGRIAVASSRGLRRAADVTSAWMEVICARQPGAGRAAAASRSLAGLDPQQVFERARRRSGPPEVVRPPEGPAPLALSQAATRALAVPPTAQRVATDEVAPTHLFLLPGEASGEELLRAADGGVWVAALEPLEVYDPQALRFRAVARGVRQVDGGALGRSLPDLVWEDDLRRVLSRVLAVGSHLVPIATGAGLFRATTAPMLAVAGAGGLRFAED